MQMEPDETAENHWEHNRFLLGDGAVPDRPRTKWTQINPVGTPPVPVGMTLPHGMTEEVWNALTTEAKTALLNIVAPKQ